MKTFIKLYGPSVSEAIRALEKIAIKMNEVCIMDSIISLGYSQAFGYNDYDALEMPHQASNIMEYIDELGDVSKERCDTLISKSGEELGDYDFFFEWYKKSSAKELRDLTEKIDKILKPIGIRYIITTK